MRRAARPGVRSVVSRPAARRAGAPRSTHAPIAAGVVVLRESIPRMLGVARVTSLRLEFQRNRVETLLRRRDVARLATAAQNERPPAPLHRAPVDLLPERGEII